MRKAEGKPIFVIQKHDATRLHYDFRLEIGGVLKSWAVPKGPSLDPAEKRLAVETEDHPMEYAKFEGVLPEGEYGAGPVIVWDFGSYDNLKIDKGRELPMQECYEKGHITIRLQGAKLKGGFSLRRFRKEDARQWLLVKIKDEKATNKEDPVKMRPESVLSGKTIEEIAVEGKS